MPANYIVSARLTTIKFVRSADFMKSALQTVFVMVIDRTWYDTKSGFKACFILQSAESNLPLTGYAVATA
jgi:hypothetical protein